MIEVNKDIIKNDRKIALTIALKYNQLKREHLEHLEVEQFVNYLFLHKWRHNLPESISEAVIEVMEADSGAIVAYLSQRAVVESKKYHLSDFDDLFRQDGSK